MNNQNEILNENLAVDSRKGPVTIIRLERTVSSSIVNCRLGLAANSSSELIIGVNLKTVMNDVTMLA